MDIAVIGLGLIGGSLLRALTAGGHRTIGFDADPGTRRLARSAGHRVGDSTAATVAGADVVVLAVPLPVVPGVLDELAGYAGLITDVTSVKGPVRDLAAARGLRRFVGGHPMAGKETSGFAATDPDLFAGCAWVLCLEPRADPRGTDLSDWLTLAELYTALGARIVPVTAAEHDRAVAEISHVPHLFASVLAGQLAGNPLAGTLGAGSFRDGTRVAASRAELTAAMCGGNAAATGAVLSRLIGELATLRELLDADDPVAALSPALRPASDLRRVWPGAAGRPGRIPAEAEPLLELGRAGGWVVAVAPDRATVTTMRTETDRISS